MAATKSDLPTQDWQGTSADIAKIDTTNLPNGSTYWDFEAQVLYTWDEEGQRWL